MQKIFVALGYGSDLVPARRPYWFGGHGDDQIDDANTYGVCSVAPHRAQSRLAVPAELH